VGESRRLKKARAKAAKIALAKRIRAFRKERGLSQEELAHRIGVHPTYLSAIERAERNPALENLDATARALGVTLAELFAFNRS
jgi:transcriptional regulator with XRE-family HTH domain